MKHKLSILIILISLLNCKLKDAMKQELKTFYIVGIATETTNKDEKSVEDMGKLWGKFYSEKITSKIPNKLSVDVYSVFTNYESDYTGKYTAIIGHKVTDLENIPTGMIGKKIDGGKYKKIIANGTMPDAVVTAWKQIWSKDKELNRRYTADFEVYGIKSQQGDNSEVEIYLGVH